MNISENKTYITLIRLNFEDLYKFVIDKVIDPNNVVKVHEYEDGLLLAMCMFLNSNDIESDKNITYTNLVFGIKNTMLA